jgi:hypothetical protein
MGYSTTANAAGMSLRETCVGRSISAVESCCDTWVRRNGKPMWMMGTGGCRSSAACSAGGGAGSGIYAIAYVKKPICYLDNTPPAHESHDKPAETHNPNTKPF